MSADISFNGSGQAEIVLRNDPAWHGLGEVITSEPGNRVTSDKILEVCPSIGFKTEKQPIYLGDGSRVEGRYATVRTDCGRALGIVGERYEVYQNNEAFAFLDSLVSDGLLEYESAMILGGGSQVVLLARLPEVDAIVPGDNLMRHLLLSTSHDGTSAINILPTNTRVVCANTLRLAMRGKNNAPYRCTVRHTASMRDNLEIAKAFIGEAEIAFAQFAESARMLASVQCSGEQAKEFVHALFPAPIDDNGKPIEGRKNTIHARKLDDISAAIREPSNRLDGMRGSWWQMLNALTFTVDHKGRQSRGTNDRERAENRFLSVIDGPGADLKARALALALSMAV